MTALRDYLSLHQARQDVLQLSELALAQSTTARRAMKRFDSERGLLCASQVTGVAVRLDADRFFAAEQVTR